MQRRYYRIRETADKRYLVEWSTNGADWGAARSRSYARRGDAVRFVNQDLGYFNGAWWREGVLSLNDDEKAALQAWKDTHEAEIEAETVPVSGLSEQEQARAEFARWLIEHGKLTDALLPSDLGLKQAQLPGA